MRVRRAGPWLLAVLCACLAACSRVEDGEPVSTWKLVVGGVSVVYLLWKLRGWLAGAGRGGGSDASGGGDWGGGDCGGGGGDC